MREDNLLGLRRQPFVPLTTDTRHRWPVVPNLGRDMQLSALDQLWVADITYIRLQQEFAYLALVLDAFSRRVIGWSMPTISAPAWRWRRWPWHWRLAARPGALSSTIPTAAC